MTKWQIDLPLWYVGLNFCFIMAVMLLLALAEPLSSTGLSVIVSAIVMLILVVLMGLNYLPLLINPLFWVIEHVNPCTGDMCFDYLINLPVYFAMNVVAMVLIGSLVDRIKAKKG